MEEPDYKQLLAAVLLHFDGAEIRIDEVDIKQAEGIEPSTFIDRAGRTVIRVD